MYESILVNPQWLKPAAVELHVDMLVKVDQSGAALSFTHRGAITCPRVTDAWQHYQAQGDSDCLMAAMQEHRLVRVSRASRDACVSLAFTDPTGRGVGVGARAVGPDQVRVEHQSGGVCGATEGERLCRYSRKDDPQAKPLYSVFSVRFQETGTQVFRVVFSTRFGLVQTPRQMSVQVEGPGAAWSREMADVEASVEDPAYRAELVDELQSLYDMKREGRYLVAVVPHPLLRMSLDDTREAPSPVVFAVDATAPVFVGGMTRALSMAFDCRTNDFAMNFSFDVPSAYEMPLSEETRSLLREARDNHGGASTEG
jgi:hypothetical protein